VEQEGTNTPASLVLSTSVQNSSSCLRSMPSVCLDEAVDSVFAGMDKLVQF